MISLLATSYFIVVVLYIVVCLLMGNNRDTKTYRYYCSTCCNHFKVVYHEIEPLKSVECPFCKNNVEAYLVINNVSHRKQENINADTER